MGARPGSSAFSMARSPRLRSRKALSPAYRAMPPVVTTSAARNRSRARVSRAAFTPYSGSSLPKDAACSEVWPRRLVTEPLDS